MGDAMWVDTDRMNMAAPGLEDVANRAARAVSTLIDTLEGLGACWGDDKWGKTFAKVYEPAAEQLQKGIKDTGTVLGGAHKGVEIMVRGFTDTETTNIKTASGLAPLDTPKAKPTPKR